MAWLNSLLIVVQLFCAVSITILILLQHGKGADMGAAFGSGASGSLFGASGSANFLSRTTAILASVFFVTTIAMAYTATNLHPASGTSAGGGVMSGSAAGGSGDKGAAPGAPAASPAPATPAQGSGAGDIPSGGAPSAAPAGQAPAPSNRPADIPK